MKLYPNTLKNPLASLFSIMLGFLSISAAHAQILLTIDDSNPSDTIISATGNFPETSVSPGLIADGVDLVGLFTSSVGLGNFTVLSSSLTTGDGSSGPIFTQASGDNYSLQDVDLNLYQNNTPDTISFTAGQAAFTGTLTLDLSSAPLPPVGSPGNIVTGYSGNYPNNTLIGQWEVVPEPSTWILMLGCLGVLAFLRRRTLQA